MPFTKYALDKIEDVRQQLIKNQNKQNLLDSLEEIRKNIPLMDKDDRDFVASLLYRMGRIVREYGPSHGVISSESAPAINNKVFCVGFRETPTGCTVVKRADSTDRLPKRNLEDLISKAIYDPPATIIYWKDGTKTVVKCQPNDFDAGRMDPETGIVYAIAKKVLGNKGNFNDILRRLVKGAKKR